MAIFASLFATPPVRTPNHTLCAHPYFRPCSDCLLAHMYISPTIPRVPSSQQSIYPGLRVHTPPIACSYHPIRGCDGGYGQGVVSKSYPRCLAPFFHTFLTPVSKACLSLLIVTCATFLVRWFQHHRWSVDAPRLRVRFAANFILAVLQQS